MAPTQHREVIIAWANGACIEYRVPNDPKWYTTYKPEWRPFFDYRVKGKHVL